ncbi:MAG: hypothetical protein KBD64_08175 [Gammaproteobacteria bacterium]|nr:hypothetical protein [Gammaproteobacteria bacterium]
MNVALFDKKLITLSGLVRSFSTTHDPSSAQAFLIRHDFSNLLELYKKIRRHLIAYRWKKESKLPVMPDSELTMKIARASSDGATPAEALTLEHYLKTLACFINKDIAKIVSEPTVPEDLKKILSNRVFIPITLLPPKYRHTICTVINQLRDLPSTFNVSIVGSQALFGLIITLLDKDIDPRNIFEVMNTRDLDVRVIAPIDISKDAFDDAVFKLGTVMRSLSSASPEIHAGSYKESRFCTFTNRESKFDLVLTTANTEISSASFGLPLFEYSSCMFVDYTALRRLAKHELYIYELTTYIRDSNFIALAYIIKQRRMLERWGFALSFEQQHEWENIPAKLMDEARQEFNRKYAATAIDWVIGSVAATVTPTRYDEKHFPSLPDAGSAASPASRVLHTTAWKKPLLLAPPPAIEKSKRSSALAFHVCD